MRAPGLQQRSELLANHWRLGAFSKPQPHAAFSTDFEFFHSSRDCRALRRGFARVEAEDSIRVILPGGLWELSGEAAAKVMVLTDHKVLHDPDQVAAYLNAALAGARLAG